ncbi:hypothetical protein GCM10023322_78620 [Rugosimonospora acidiphila]|uniref:F5/8 type C domain-containing protein n=1 Tax=Rugosimonospora acidiphila TaxID=556531 RepID=A0ABP9STP2_9ACTN
MPAEERELAASLARTNGRRRAPRRLAAKALIACFAMVASMVATAGTAHATYHPGEPAGMDPGTPPFVGSADPVPAPPGTFDPSKSELQTIYDADVAAGGTSYWFDRILARPYLNDSDPLMTRGRALYMYSTSERQLGFQAGGTGANGGGGYAYRQPPTTGAAQNLYTVAVSGATVTEDTSKQLQYPSYFSGVYNAGALNIAEKKFITDNDVAVTDLTLTNTGTTSTTTTLTASSPIATTPSADNSELTGTVAIRYALTTIFPRFSGDGFTASGNALTRTVTLAPNASISLKLQLGAIATEIPQSLTDYQRYRGYDPNTAWLTQMKEYNQFWVDTVPYVDLPDANVEKISYYRTWENRYNTFDGNIPGNDYQFPVDLEGALGYNNQISLTVPMRMNDLEYWRDPEYSYGSWLSQGEESACQAYHDNPGNTGNWNNTYEQWTSAQAWQSYLIHGGPTSVVNNLAEYSDCDLEGTLGKIDTNKNDLIEYSSGTLPGNDADSVAFKYYGTRPQDRTESSYWYAGAQAASQEYALVGNTAKSSQMSDIASGIKSALLNNLWASGPVTNTPTGTGTVATGPRVTGKIGNAVPLSGSSEYVSMPTGIVSGLSDFTISTWVNPGANTTWSRVFDIGTGTGTYMFLTVNAGSGPRFAITTGGSGAEQQLNATSQLPLNQWSLLTVTLSGTTGTLYVNGNPVSTNANMTLHPSNLGNTNQNWIGRSAFGDPYLNAKVDDFQIYDHALPATDVQALAGGQPGAGNVASYKFDEASGATATDSSGNGKNATIISSTKPTVTCPGGVFLQKDLTTGNLVCWKDQQNFTPFINGIPPDTAEYTQALRYYASSADFPIFPVYTADQADQAADIACAACSQGTNNFSNINATLQAMLYSSALRKYPSQYITPDMYRQLIEWLAWNEDINGNNQFPDNNEYFFNWNPTTQTLGRSGIHDDVLGSFNWMFFQDIAGLQSRLDNQVELYPIDMGYDHFTANNLSYHGSNLTIVWQKPGGTVYYPNAPMGYSLYIDGKRAFTVDDLAHVTWNSATGAVTVNDGSATQVSAHAAVPLKTATQVSLSDNARMVDSFQKAGVDISSTTGGVTNLAQGKTATASFTTTTPASQRTSPANAVDGFTISGLPVTSGSYVGTNPIWGDVGSPNAQDWLQVDLGKPTQINNVKLYFYSNKQFGSGGNTYREPSSYSVQYFDGTNWVDIPNQAHSPGTPQANYNEVDFAPVTAQQVRVLMTRQTGFAVGLKEVQVENVLDWQGFSGRVGDEPTVNSAPAGAAVPVSFGIGGDQGTSVLAGSPQFQPMYCGTDTPSGPAVSELRSAGLHYDPATKQYVYTWQTDKGWKGTCGQLDLKLSDGTTHSATFSFS